MQSLNVAACCSLSDVLASSLGPAGYSKLFIDSNGSITVTNDGSTVLQYLGVRHPAAQILIELARLQDLEVGDGTSSVVVVAAELIRKGYQLVKQKIHPSVVITGFRTAMKAACKYVESRLAIPVAELGEQCLVHCGQTSLYSKGLGNNLSFLSRMILEAVLAVKKVQFGVGSFHYPVRNVNVLKVPGGCLCGSRLLPGHGYNMSRMSSLMPSVVWEAKISCLDVDFRRNRLPLDVQISSSNPCELEKIRESEVRNLEVRFKGIVSRGANLVMTTGSVDNVALRYFVQAGVMAFRRVLRGQMRRVARVTGAVVETMPLFSGRNNYLGKVTLGVAKLVYEEVICGVDITVIKGCGSFSAVTFVLRGGSEFVLDELERSVHDALCVVKGALEGGTVVPGGGAVEASINAFLNKFAHSGDAKERIAISVFGESFLAVPKSLLRNTSLDVNKLLAELSNYHDLSLVRSAQPWFSHFFRVGISLTSGMLCDVVDLGVYSPTSSNINIIGYATEAAITVLRVDDALSGI